MTGQNDSSEPFVAHHPPYFFMAWTCPLDGAAMSAYGTAGLKADRFQCLGAVPHEWYRGSGEWVRIGRLLEAAA